jgi:single-strand DNA-binding protein
MADINNVTLAGRLTRDAELKYLNSGVAVLKFAMAVNARKRDASGEWLDEPNFFDVTLFGKSAEALNSYLLKGKQVAVSGELRQDRWESEGQARSRVYVLANNIMLIGGGKDGGNHERNSHAEPAERSAPAAKPKKSAPPVDDFEDDIPF